MLIERRTRSTALALLLLAATATPSLAMAERPQLPLRAARPAAKNVILFIGDGMQLQHEMAASNYLFGNYTGMSWMKFPYRGQVATWDVTTYDRYAYAGSAPSYAPADFNPIFGYDPARGGKTPYPLDTTGQDAYFLTKLPTAKLSPAYPATDSASAGTAIATGHKTDDGNIAWLPGDPADGALRTIAEELREKRKKAIGVVSTVPFSHATPAAFVSHNVSRNNYYTGLKGYAGVGIADEIITVTRPEVVIGGGHPMLDNPVYDTTKGYISKPLHEALRASDEYVLAERTAGSNGSETLLAAAGKAAMEKKKLFGLFGGKGGNFEPPVPADNPGNPMVTRVSIENPAFADTVTAALTVLSQDQDGFFLMAEQGDIDWANHADDYRWMVGTVHDLNEGVKAAIAFVDRPGDDIDWDNTLILVTSDHGNSYMRLNDAKPLAKGDLPAQTMVNGAQTYPDGEVTYGSGSHTNELVSLYAIGSGAEILKRFEGTWYPGTAIIDNTHIYKAMRAATLAPARAGEAMERE